MYQELAILKDAIERFRPFVEQRFVDEILYAEGMRSDLTSKLEDMDFLNAAERDKLKEYAADVQRICNRCVGSLNSLPFS